MDTDNRIRPRRRTRLRSGKLADLGGKFLVECLIYDRSADGARLRVEGTDLVPDRLLLFDDEQNVLTAAAVVWRRSNELGIRFSTGPDASQARKIARKLTGRYYAL